jgi:hypothetical protein
MSAQSLESQLLQSIAIVHERNQYRAALEKISSGNRLVLRDSAALNPAELVACIEVAADVCDAALAKAKP